MCCNNQKWTYCVAADADDVVALAVVVVRAVAAEDDDVDAADVDDSSNCYNCRIYNLMHCNRNVARVRRWM